MRYGIDVYTSEDHDVPNYQSGYIFDNYADAAHAAEARMDRALSHGVPMAWLEATVVSDDAELTDSGSPSVEDYITPATLGWLPSVEVARDAFPTAATAAHRSPTFRSTRSLHSEASPGRSLCKGPGR